MAGTHVDVDLGEVRRVIGELLDRIGDATEVFQDFGEYLLLESDRRFDRQSAPDGTPWAPLKPETLARKRIPKILTERSRLRDSLAYDAEPERLTLYTPVIYAAIHQFGGTAGRGAKIPARPFMGLAEDDVAELRRLMTEHLDEHARSLADSVR